MVLINFFHDNLEFCHIKMVQHMAGDIIIVSMEFLFGRLYLPHIFVKCPPSPVADTSSLSQKKKCQQLTRASNNYIFVFCYLWY